MACYRPIPAHQIQTEGAKSVKLWPPLGTANLAIPCSKCIGCRSARATQWAHRCSHEASQWDHNTFITLTYDDEHLPKDGHLEPESLQRFLKRLRKRSEGPTGAITRDRRRSIRYFACGEYGERSGRPHYHAILFNAGFNDRRKVGKDLYESALLADLWPYGQNRIGDATPAAASYIAQYSMKKQGAGDHDADGVYRPAPFLRMSLKPAIGLEWLKKYQTDLQHGYLIADGFKHGIPRTYKERLKDINPQLAEVIIQRIENQRKQSLTSQDIRERRKAGEQMQKRYKELTENRKL